MIRFTTKDDRIAKAILLQVEGATAQCVSTDDSWTITVPRSEEGTLLWLLADMAAGVLKGEDAK